jgi:rSAM/selenodomain-associated transferase 2/rSAM/selenodomain-associated transferase 1
MPERGRRLVLEFGRTPRAGSVKTRLARTEGAAEAARIYRLLAEEVHRVLLEGQTRGAFEMVFCLPDGEAPWLPGAAHHWGQGPGDLGQRLTRAFARAFEEGADAVLCVGTDLVDLDERILERAFRYLEEADVVLAPTPDGGYGLIGMRAPQPTLFEDIPWSSPAVAQQTRTRVKAAGLRLLEVEGLRDVDVAADLEGAVPTLSILVPVLDEAPRLARNLAALMEQVRAERGVEVLVADGGSTDGSQASARDLGAEVFDTERGRGVQLADIASRARGRWLWTLHADAWPARGAVAGALAFCRRDTHPWGICETAVADASPLLRNGLRFADARARFFRLPYGDQGILVRRSVFDHHGGYAALPLMEDVLLARVFRAYGPPARIAAHLEIDGRRWRRQGVVRTTLRNWWTIARFLWLRADPEQLARSYYGDRQPGPSPPDGAG